MSSLRRWAIPIAVIAALLLAYLVNPWSNPSEPLLTIVTVAFWALSILLVVVLFQDRKQPGAETVEIEGPSFTRFLFSNSRAGLLWLPIRLFVGFAFLGAGLTKLGESSWTGGGSAIAGFWANAVKIPADGGHAAITYGWYRDFLNILINNHTESWFAWVILLGEIAVGVGLVLGILTGFAAFGGVLMNMTFLLAGSSSTNPILFSMGIGLILAWKVAGYYGVDRYLLPRLGTPWRPNLLVRKSPTTGAPAPA